MHNIYRTMCEFKCVSVQGVSQLLQYPQISMSVRLVTTCVQSSLAATILSVVMSVIVTPDTLMTDRRFALVRTQYHKRFKQMYVNFRNFNSATDSTAGNKATKCCYSYYII